MTKNLHSIECQEQALSKGGQRGTRSVQDVASDGNMAVGTLRNGYASRTERAKLASLWPSCVST